MKEVKIYCVNLFQSTKVKRQRLKPKTIAGKGVYFVSTQVYTNTFFLKIT